MVYACQQRLLFVESPTCKGEADVSQLAWSSLMQRSLLVLWHSMGMVVSAAASDIMEYILDGSARILVVAAGGFSVRNVMTATRS
jgi:hypothetical protein